MYIIHINAHKTLNLKYFVVYLRYTRCLANTLQWNAYGRVGH